jgi:hypothetical protein
MNQRFAKRGRRRKLPELSKSRALELVWTFRRTANFPQAEGDIANMADGLMEAARNDQNMAEQIVNALRRTAKFCPTDADFFQTAEILGNVIEQYVMKTCPAGKCDGSGWIPVNVRGLSAVKKCECHQ